MLLRFIVYVTRDSRAGRVGKEWGTNKIHGVLYKFPYGIRHKTCQNKAMITKRDALLLQSLLGTRYTWDISHGCRKINTFIVSECQIIFKTKFSRSRCDNKTFLRNYISKNIFKNKRVSSSYKHICRRKRKTYNWL